MVPRRGRHLRIAIEGPSGAGKSTLAPALARALGGRPVAEAYDRLGRPDLAPGGGGALLALELRLLEEEARRFRGGPARDGAGAGPWVYDTGLLGPVTYLAAWATWAPARAAVLDPLVGRAAALVGAGRLGLPDLTLYLRPPDAEVARRLAGDPTGHPRPLRARHARAAALEGRWWTGAIRRALPGRVVVLRGAGDPGSVARRAAAAVKGFRRRPPPGPAQALAVLELLRRASRRGASRRRSGKG